MVNAVRGKRFIRTLGTRRKSRFALYFADALAMMRGVAERWCGGRAGRTDDGCVNSAAELKTTETRDEKKKRIVGSYVGGARRMYYYYCAPACWRGLSVDGRRMQLTATCSKLRRGCMNIASLIHGASVPVGMWLGYGHTPCVTPAPFQQRHEPQSPRPWRHAASRRRGTWPGLRYVGSGKRRCASCASPAKPCPNLQGM